MASGNSNKADGMDVDTDIITLSRFILTEQNKLGPAITGDFTLLLNALQFAFKFIAYNIRRASLINLIGLAGAANKSGDEQKKLDVIGDEIFINAMKGCGKVKLLVSEEQEEPIIFNNDGKYCVVCDPIDGSSNLDAGVSVGTIFGVYRVKDGSKGTIEDVLRPGKEMICAGYALYAASTFFVLTTGQGVNGFTLDNSFGEFILTHPNMRIPRERGIYSVNEGNSLYWDAPCKEYFDSIKFPKEGKPYSARYIGSMVADVQRTLLYGGIFVYASDSRNKQGKLRCLYEAFPMAMLVEQAGGKAFNGSERILDCTPKTIHERMPIWLGSELEVDKVIEIFKKHGRAKTM